MGHGHLKRAACLLLAGALAMGCFSACGGTGQAPPESPAPAPEPARPALVEPDPPELPPAAVVNGDFEQGFDGQGQLRGWTVTFSEWGEGEAAVAYSPSTEEDNTGNTTQKLSLYNGMPKAVDFSVSQTVEGVAAGEYIVSLIFEGGPADAQTGTRLCVNGTTADFGSYSGWKNWKQVVSQRIAVEQNGTVSIEITGRMNSKDWMDLDDVELVPADAFRARSFAPAEPEAVTATATAAVGTAGEAPVTYDRLTNGNFETPADENGRLPGWTVEFADWGAGEKRASYRLTTEKDNRNTTQKLSLGNSTGKNNTFAVRQKFLAAEAGDYIVAFDWEADPYRWTSPALYVNGQRTWAGYGQGWKNWKQTASSPVRLEKGGVVRVEISGTMEDGGWMDIDNVIFVPASEYAPKWSGGSGSSGGGSSSDTPAPPPPEDIQNGDFSQGIIWDDPGYPDGRLPGWTLPRSVNWNKWRFNTETPKTFAVSNISSESGASPFTISQQFLLKPDTYTLDANSPWVVGDDSISTISVTIAEVKGWTKAKAGGSSPVTATLPVTLTLKPGSGKNSSHRFTVAEEMLVSMKVTFSLVGKTDTAVKDLAVTPVSELPPAEPDPADRIQNGDFSQGIVWDDPDHPDGYLPCWTLPASVDWDKWRFNTDTPNTFEVNNVSSDSGASSFTISQQVRLKPDSYTLDANSPWTWNDADSVSAVTLTATEAEAKAGSGFPVTLSMKPGYGPNSSARFTVTEETLVEVKVTFSLVGGATAAVKDLAFTPAAETPPEPAKTQVTWTGAVQTGGTGGTADSTAVDMTFSQAVPGLSAANFTVEGAAAGALTDKGNGGYTLAISGITVDNGGNITVSVTGPEGYEIAPASQTVQVWKQAATPPDPAKTQVTWTSAVQGGGESGTTDSATVEMVFSQKIPELTAANFTIEGATAGTLGENTTEGSYWLTISDLTVGDGEEITVTVTAPEGYEITPDSQTVQVWRAGEEEPFTDPIENGDFSAITVWPVPDGWTLTLGGSSITDWPSYCTWAGDDQSTGTIDTENGGIYFWHKTSLEGLSLSQSVSLSPGSYRLNYELEASSWGITFSVADASKSEETSSGLASGSLEFEISTEDTYKIAITKPRSWANDLFRLSSVSLEKLS